MNDIIEIYKKNLEDRNKKPVKGTLSLIKKENTNDDIIVTKNFQIAANSKFFTKNNIQVVINNKDINNDIDINNGIETINIFLIIDKKKIYNIMINNKDDLNNLLKKINNIEEYVYITYIINNTRQLYIFTKINVDTDENNNSKDITNEFENDNLLYELYNKINKYYKNI